MKDKLNDIVCQSSCDYEILNDVYNYIERIEKENQQLKKQLEQKDNIINKAREYVNDNVYIEDNGCGLRWWEIADKGELLEILDIEKE